MKRKISKNENLLWSAPKYALALLVVIFMLTPMLSAQGYSYPAPLVPPATSTWWAVTLIAVLTIIAIAALVYVLSGIIDSPNARGWARFQIYEGILSIVLLLIFLAFIYLLFSNANAALSAINLVPSNPQSLFDCSQAYDLFDLATCNISVFDRFAFGIFAALYYSSIYFSYTPGIGVSVESGQQLGTNVKVSGGSSLESLVPLSVESSFGSVFSLIIIFFVLNQIQAYLLAGSLLWLGFFVSIGIIARAFGFTRTFGGAMIAMGLGLGVIYPLVTDITYGFINHALSLPGIPNTGTAIAGQLLQSLIPVFFGQGFAWAGPWVLSLGIGVAGLTFIPFLNFTIVDAFIVDFSRSIGERLDFMSLLIGLI